MQLPELPIAIVSRETGIAKEVLRKWESRYGFPAPQRDASGNRLYSTEQIDRLRLIKRLIDDGMRPAQVVSLQGPDLAALVKSREQPAMRIVQPAVALGSKWLTSRDPDRLRDELQCELVRVGLKEFIVDVMPAWNRLVGDAWESGKIGVRDEHLYTEVVQALLRDAIGRIAVSNGAPRVLITTPAGELHTLGVLMVHGFLALHGARCLSLGAQTPSTEIGLAASDCKADIVALSFSAAFPRRGVIPVLKEVRAALAPEKALWAGGSGVSGLASTPRGVRILHTFQDMRLAWEKHRKTCGT